MEQLQVGAVCDVAQPHADPEVGWECVLLSFTLWVLSQRQIKPMGVQIPQGQERGEGGVHTPTLSPGAPGAGALYCAQLALGDSWTSCSQRAGGAGGGAALTRGPARLHGVAAMAVTATMILAITDCLLTVRQAWR